MKSKIILITLLITLSLASCGSTVKSSAPAPQKSEDSFSDEDYIDEDYVDDDYVDEEDYGTDFESTWGDLVEANDGDLVYDTLTPSQRALIHFPEYDPDCVYYVPDGTAYHSVDWCYTLSRSKDIRSTTESEAEDVMGLGPCSKCVP